MLRFIASMRFGIILMAIIIITSIFSTFVPMQGEESGFFSWLLITLPRIFMSILLINLIFCSIQHLPNALKMFSKASQDKDLKAILNPDNTIVVKDINSYQKKLEKYFAKNNYKIKTISSGDLTNYTAQKSKISLLAPHILHIGLIVVLLGALIGSFFGAEERLAGTVGQTVRVPEVVNDRMFVKINDFRTIFDERGDIHNWQSDITVNDGTDEVSGITEVNKPFKHKGVVFYQTAYNLSHNVIIEAKEQPRVERAIKNRSLDEMAAMFLGNIFFFDINKDGVQITIFKDRDDYRTVSIKEGETIDFPNGSLTYLNTEEYTVLTAKKDPGTYAVMLGFIIMSLSSIFFWMGRYSEIRIDIDTMQNSVAFKVFSKGKGSKEEILNELSLSNGEEY